VCLHGPSVYFHPASLGCSHSAVVHVRTQVVTCVRRLCRWCCVVCCYHSLDFDVIVERRRRSAVSYVVRRQAYVQPVGPLFLRAVDEAASHRRRRRGQEGTPPSKKWDKNIFRAKIKMCIGE